MGFRYFRPSPSSHSLSVHGDLHVWSALEALTILLEELSELLHLKPVPTKSMACRNLCSTVDHNRSYIMLSHLLGYTWILIFLILHIPKCSKLFCCFARGRGLLPFSAKDKALRSPRGTRVFRREATVGKVIESLCSKSCHCRLPYHGPSIMLVNNGWQWLIMATVIMIDSSVNLPEAHSPQRSPESLWLVHEWTATDPVLAAPCASTAHRSLVYPHWIPCRKWGFQSPQDMTLEPQQPSFCQACPSLYFQNLTSSLYHLCIIFVSCNTSPRSWISLRLFSFLMPSSKSRAKPRNSVKLIRPSPDVSACENAGGVHQFFHPNLVDTPVVYIRIS